MHTVEGKDEAVCGCVGFISLGPGLGCPSCHWSREVVGATQDLSVLRHQASARGATFLREETVSER